jgi:hypothetical protein
MRPNIDSSHTLNGRVKDYAERQALSIEQAYRESIKAWLDAVGHPEES